MIEPEEILEGLDLSRAEPGIGYLEALFARFNARVPFESATKILRNAAVSDPAKKPRRPELFWREHLSSGAGGTCFARAEAFRALLEALGFAVVRALGKVGKDSDHAALFVDRDGRRILCDVGFPLPGLLPAAPGHTASPLGTVEVQATGRGLAVTFADGAPEGLRTIEVFSAPVTEEEFEGRWRETFRPGAHFLSGVKLRIEREGRSMSFADGAVRVDDLHSRLTVPLSGPRARRLSELFGLDGKILEQAFAVAGNPEPPAGAGSLAAYLETPGSPEQAFAAVATAERYSELAEGLGSVSAVDPTPSGFRLRLRAPQREGGEHPAEAFVEEDVTVDSSGRRLTVRRRGAAGRETRLDYRVESRGGATFLVAEILFESPREDLLRNDALRGRLAGSLAVDLLAWGRLIAR